MVKVYGSSDDLVEIEGSKYREDEIGCFEKDVIISFADGTQIRVGYPKGTMAVWFISVIKHGTAMMRLSECDDEDAEVYSDIFEIDSEVVSHVVVPKGADIPGNFTPGQYVVYQCGDRFEIGRIKRVASDGAFVWYSGGDTAAMTRFDNIHPIDNEYVIRETVLGGMR